MLHCMVGAMLLEHLLSNILELEKLSIKIHLRMKAGRFSPHVIKERTGSVKLNNVFVKIS